jgi:hypothetical protein
MKTRAILSLLLAVIAVAGCGGSSGGGDDTGYTLQPGEVTTFTTGVTSYTVDYSAYSGSGETGTYAVIYKGGIAGANYVAIGIDADPATKSAFKCKLYFQSSTIPSSIALNTGNSQLKVYTGGDGITPSATLNGSYTLNISGPDSNSVYTISSPDTIPLTPGTLTISSINAILVTTDLTDDDDD